MPAGINSIMNKTAFAFVATSLLAINVASADTDVAPPMSISLSSNDSSMTFDPGQYGSTWKEANSVFGFAGSNSTDSIGLNWSMLVNPDPFVIANIVVTNNSLVTQTFTLTVSLPTTLLSNACIGGSISGSVSDLNGNGATLSAPGGGGAVYTALIDGSPVQQLLTDPFSVSTGNYLTSTVGPASFGDPIPSMPYAPGVMNSIGITISFTLTAGDAAAFTSIFVVEECIPGPAAFALLGMAGLVGTRRRRA